MHILKLALYTFIAVVFVHIIVTVAANAINEESCDYATSITQTIYANEHLYSSPQAMLNALEPHTNYLMENCND